MKFEDLGLSPDVLRALEDSGYSDPTPIQAQAIPAVLASRDVLGIAQTGTGKTAAFTLPILTILAHGRARARIPRSLILCPTRELAAQVAASFETYGKYHKLIMALLIGGVSFAEQNARIDRGADVLIATPGRLLDHFERGRLMLTGVQICVIDEADRMLDMGFIPDVETNNSVAAVFPADNVVLGHDAARDCQARRGIPPGRLARGDCTARNHRGKRAAVCRSIGEQVARPGACPFPVRFFPCSGIRN